MASPIIVLPYERVFKPQSNGKWGVANDMELAPELGARISDVLGKDRRFGDAPFFRDDVWRYVDGVDVFNIADPWAQDVLEKLEASEAAARARGTDGAVILGVLRNALAHGGVAYLDRNGRQSEEATEMLAFVSLAQGRLRILRARVDDFHQFLSLWVDWLLAAGVADEINQAGPGCLGEAFEPGQV